MAVRRLFRRCRFSKARTPGALGGSQAQNRRLSKNPDHSRWGTNLGNGTKGAPPYI